MRKLDFLEPGLGRPPELDTASVEALSQLLSLSKLVALHIPHKSYLVNFQFRHIPLPYHVRSNWSTEPGLALPFQLNDDITDLLITGEREDDSTGDEVEIRKMGVRTVQDDTDGHHVGVDQVSGRRSTEDAAELRQRPASGC